MSFTTGLSGIAAANKDLQITGNNIANASTTGFKASRAEFGDAYTSSFIGYGQDKIGYGVSVVNVGQKFEQGSISQTNSALDMAIDGEGFFVTEYPNGTVTYTRSGIFGIDKEGYIVSNQDAKLQGYGVIPGDKINTGVLTDLRVDKANQPPRGTHQVDARVNVPAGAQVLAENGTIVTTAGLAIGAAQVGPTEDTATVLNTVGVPTTAGTNAELIGGIPRMAFPWQPTPVEASFTIDVELRGPNIPGTNNTVTGTIQPFDSTIVYADVYELVDAINASISGDSGLRGKVEATVNQYGGLSFQTSGVYATDGTSIVSIVDNVGTLSGDAYLNFQNGTAMLSGTVEPGLEVVNAATFTTLTGGRDLNSIDNVGNFLDAEGGNTIDFIASVNGVATTVSVAVPAAGWATFAAFATDVDLALTGAGVNANAAMNGNFLEITSTLPGDIPVSINHLPSSSSTIDMTDLGMTTGATFAPTVTLGLQQNDTLTIDLDGGAIIDTITLNPAVYANVDLLVQEINNQILASAILAPAGVPEIRALNDNGTLVFDRLNNPGVPPADIAITGTVFTLDYFGLSTVDTQTTPSVVAPVPGDDLFANGGSIDLTSDPGQAATLVSNSQAELDYNNTVPGTFTTLTSSSTLNFLDNTGPAFGDLEAGNTFAFGIAVGSASATGITMTVPAGGFPSQANFAASLQAQINATLGGNYVAVSIDGATNQLIIQADVDAGVGPNSITITHLPGATNTTAFDLEILGLATTSSPQPIADLGESTILANNEFTLTIDGGVPQTIIVPPGSFDNTDDLVAAINQQISTNSILNGEVVASQVNGRLVFERTEIGNFPLDIDINGTVQSLQALGMDSATKIEGEDPVDRENSFRINLTVPLPDEDERSGSVLISLNEDIRSIDQLAAAINRELAAVPDDEYIGVQARVIQNENGEEQLILEATVEGEASQISVTNIRAPGEDLDVETMYGLLQFAPVAGTYLVEGEAAVTNGYPEQSVVIYNEDADERELVTIPEGSTAGEIAAQLSEYEGVDASAETQVRLLNQNYINSGDMNIFINGQVIVANDLEEMVAEINQYQQTSLNSITAEFDTATGDVILTSSTGIDISVRIESDTVTDTLRVQGTRGSAPVVLGGSIDAETNARIGGYVDIILNEGYTMLEPDPYVAGLFNGLGKDAFEPYTINAFNPEDSDTYNETRALTIHDSIGNEHELRFFYVKDEPDPDRPNSLSTWTVYLQIDGENIGDPDTNLPFPENTQATMASHKLFFNADGTLNEDVTGDFLISNWKPIDPDTGKPTGAYIGLPQAQGGALPIPDPNLNSNFAISFDGTTQYGGSFANNKLIQDGYASGRLSDLEIDDAGIIYARYSNGEALKLGQVVLASFANTEGLIPVGDTEWVEGFESGDAVIGEPGTASLGTIQSAALEDSTVDLSEQLVHLIIAQRNYQASSKTIETANAVTQTIINLR
ncbi:flagellar hook-basal body complex protein [Saccharospirillum mangrovi]|uniref:flagellar hook-basal body complex protein n=1 Tax=Saccharospirillum mangrovi TaxID=2161747 RepID=UPI000D3C77A2|nr:flagellar hook-basal body complex protein [Saccharospirillum mangrovi]